MSARPAAAAAAPRPRWLAAAFAVAVAIRLLFVIAVPHDQTVRFGLEGFNDEPSHLRYAKFLGERRAFPVQTMSIEDPRAFIDHAFEYYQPPLYYLLCAPFTAVLDGRAERLACRLLSFAFGLATLAAIGMVLRRAGAPRPAADAAVLFLALLPSHVYFTSVVSNDPLCWLLCTLLLDRIVALADAHATAPRGTTHAALGGLLVLAVLTKASAVLLAPLVGLGYAVHAWRTRRAAVLVQGAAVLAAAAALLTPWHLRNVRLYGTLFGLNKGFGAAPAPLTSPGEIVALVKGTVRTFWFPMQHLPAGDVRALAIHALGAALLAGCAALAVRRLAARRPSAGEALLLAALALVALAYVVLQITWANREARLLYPALAAIAWLVAVPVWEVAARRWRERWVAPALALVALHPYAHLLFVRP
jgi:hypothetical protein